MHRTGAVAPTARQRRLAAGADLRTTWNRFGTPGTLTARSGYVARGLSRDPVAAARQWVGRNEALLGIGDADLELVGAAPIGAGRAVMLRQRFGALDAGRDGLIVLGVKGGNVAYVASTLAKDTQLTGAHRLDADAAVRAAAADAGLQPGALIKQPRLVAVPTPERGVRRAWEVQLYADGAEPLAVQSFVDADTGGVLIRDGLIDHLADNPTWTVFRSSPPLDYSTTDTRQRWCWIAITGCALVVGNPASSVPWDIDARTNAPTFTTDGNNAFAVHNWFSNQGNSVGTERATSRPDREYAYTWTNQWHEQRCNPATFTSPAARRHRRGAGEPVRDAQPDARLGVPARLHRGRLEPAVVQLRPRRSGERPGARECAGRRRQRRPARLRRPRQRESVLAARRPGAGHEHVHVAADRRRLLLAVRGRRLRHVGDRARVHACDLEPDGGRPEREPVRQPGRRDGRELV